MNKYYISGLVLVLLVAVGAYFYPKTAQTFGASPAGASFGDAKTAFVTMNLANPGANGTTTSYLNSTVNDLYIKSEEAGCKGLGTSNTAYTGTGLAALTFTIATSSTANPATNSNTNTLPVITVATSTGNFVISSSTAGTPGTNVGVTAVSDIWAAGSYLTVTANATNTGACTVGISYFSS